MTESLENNSTGRTRVTLDLSKRLIDILEAMAKEKDTTKADVLRAAIEYLAMANDAERDGMQVGAWKDEKDVRRERVFVGLS
jgi:hypothetical protein